MSNGNRILVVLPTREAKARELPETIDERSIVDDGSSEDTVPGAPSESGRYVHERSRAMAEIRRTARSGRCCAARTSR